MSIFEMLSDGVKHGRLRRLQNGEPSLREHFMIVLDRVGHTTVTWNPDDAESQEKARREFARLRSEGYTAFRMDVVTENGVVVEQKGERVSSFDPEAGKLMMIPQLQGG